jgi:hypothetical protein
MNAARSRASGATPLISVVVTRSGAIRTLVLAETEADEVLAQRALERLRRLWAGRQWHEHGLQDQH